MLPFGVGTQWPVSVPLQLQCLQLQGDVHGDVAQVAPPVDDIHRQTPAILFTTLCSPLVRSKEREII